MSEPKFRDTIVYESSVVRIGAFRCDREYPGFRDTGPTNNDCFVFPRTAVQIEHENELPFVASPNIATFYNRSQRYRRQAISALGDRCDWFGVDRQLALDAVRTIDPAAHGRPFRSTRARCDSRTYFLQRRLFDGVVSGKITDPVAIEETVVLLLERLLGKGAPAAVNRRWSAVVHEVERLLTSQFDQRITLAQIARHTGLSVYHLCRAFRSVTGLALHQYIQQLRIRHGLERVCESEAHLSRIAVDLGFAHHSHFTNAFRREFGITPSKLRSS